MTSRPGEITLSLTFSGQDAIDLIRMAQAARTSKAALGKSIVRQVLADDRVAHQALPYEQARLAVTP